MGVVDELEEGICLVYFLVYPMIFHRTNAGHRWKIGYKDVSFPNQRRIKDVHERLYTGFVPRLIPVFYLISIVLSWKKFPF